MNPLLPELLRKHGKKAKLPRALSEGEERLASHLRASNIQFEREYLFFPARKWRFDFAFPEKKIAVEVEGGSASLMSPGRHQRQEGFENDMDKYNRAALLGWKVLRYTTRLVKNGFAIDQIIEALGEDYVRGGGQ